MNRLLTAVEVLGAIPGMKGPALLGLDVSNSLIGGDLQIAADHGMIGNSVEGPIHVDADLPKRALAAVPHFGACMASH